MFELFLFFLDISTSLNMTKKTKKRVAKAGLKVKENRNGLLLKILIIGQITICPYEIINHSFTKLAANLAVLSAMSKFGFTSATSSATNFSDFKICL